MQADTGREVWRTSVDGAHRRRCGQRRPLCRGGDARGRTGRARRRQAGLAQGHRHQGGDRAAGGWRARLRARRGPRVSSPSTCSTAASCGSLQRPGEPLTLAQGGVLAAFKDTLLVGQGAATGRARPAATARCAGRCRWHRRAAPTRWSAWPTWSRPCCALGDSVCVRAFQSAVGCVNAERGNAAVGQDHRRHRGRGRQRAGRRRRRCVGPPDRLAHRRRARSPGPPRGCSTAA